MMCVELRIRPLVVGKNAAITGFHIRDLLFAAYGRRIGRAESEANIRTGMDLIRLSVA